MNLNKISMTLTCLSFLLMGSTCSKPKDDEDSDIDNHIAKSSIHFTQANISISESQISDLQAYLTDITSESVKNLSDVNSSMSPTDGQVLTWDNANSRWDASDASASGGGAIVNLSDVYSSMSPTDGQVLTWDNANSRWDASSASAGALVNLSDVYSSMSPTDGQVLTWDNANSRWDASSPSGGSTDHGALTGLTDDDHTQYLLANGTRAMTGNLNIGSGNDIYLNLGRKIIFDSGNNNLYIDSFYFWGLGIMRYTAHAQHKFHISSTSSSGSVQIVPNHSSQSFIIRNSTDTANAFRMVADGRSQGLPFTYVGGHSGNINGITDISWGGNSAVGPIVLPVDCILTKVTIGLTKASTSGSFIMQMEVDGDGDYDGITGTVEEVFEFDGDGTDSGLDYKLVNPSPVATYTFNAGTRLRFRTNNNGGHTPTSGQSPTLTLFFVTDE